MCVSNPAALSVPALKELESELESLLPGTAVLLPESGCSRQPDSVLLSIHHSPPDKYVTALGLAWRRGGRILPDLEAYVRPVVKAAGGVATAGVVGRALARVAAHELVHFLRQQSHHSESGLMRERFPTPALLDEDFRF